MPATPKPSARFSTNRSNAKARRRRMDRSDAERVEEAAKLADYKAMLNARKSVQQDPDFAQASDSEKSTMLEMVMRETMQKRRARGQDTMSKMAAFRAGRYRGSVGPHTRVPIADFLRNNGFVPSGPTSAHQRGAATGDGGSEGSAPVADVEEVDEVDNPFAGAYGVRRNPGRQRFNPSSQAPSGSSRPSRRSGRLLESQRLCSPTPLGVKPATGAYASMSPEPVRSTIEGDVSMADADQSLTRLQTEMRHLRNMYDNIEASNRHVRDVELERIQADLSMERSRTQDLQVKVNQLEGMVHAMQNTSLGSIVDRVNDLEGAVEQLNAKVGEGPYAEIANMREVFGGLLILLNKVGGFA
ncbi:hypothetical protein DHEL01_v204161 [Diaporthe helianthi]|uniref:Uncharacterized protein n=1 Tax=Diaporthe helianthi TaxID=158607 RepID=A0A2P5I4L9_DIAHE|nr:hypothetical protein DHEL01_v204161 [Diaporthe helianthi]